MIRKVLLKFLCPQALKHHLYFAILQEIVEWMLQKWLGQTKNKQTNKQTKVWIPLRWTLGVLWFGWKSKLFEVAGESPCRQGVVFISAPSNLSEKRTLPPAQPDLGCTGPAGRIFVWQVGRWEACTSAFGVAGTGSNCQKPPPKESCDRASWESSSLAKATAGLSWLAHLQEAGSELLERSERLTGPDGLGSGAESLLTLLSAVDPKPNTARAWASGIGLSPCTDHFSQKQIKF